MTAETYDDEAMTSYIRLTDAPVASTVQRRDAHVLIDYDTDGEIVGIELLWHPLPLLAASTTLRTKIKWEACRD